MKKTGLCIAGICALALGLSVAAIHASPQSNADVSGTWTLTVVNTPMPPVPNGGQAAIDAAAAAAASRGQGGGGGRGAGRGPAGPPTVTLTQNGGDITGTLAGGRGPGVPLRGMVAGNNVSWTVTRRLSDGIGRDATYKATVTGDTMTGTIAEPTVDPTQAYSDTFTAKRGAPMAAQ